MRVGMVGINGESCPLQLREKLARVFTYDTLPSGSGVILSTCHRSEYYFHHEDLPSFHSELLQRLRNVIEEPFEHALYVYFERECFFHLAHVTAGLDSAWIGETEIQGQVKRAYQQRQDLRELPSPLHYLFQKSLHLGKKLRSLPQFLSPPASLGKQLFHALRPFLTDISQWLFIGFSQLHKEIIPFLRPQCSGTFSLMTRHPEKALPFAERHQLRLLDYADLEKWGEFPIVCVATQASEPLIDAIPPYPLRTKFLMDLSMPRLIDPDILSHPQLTLMDLETFKHAHRLSSENSRKRRLLEQSIRIFTSQYHREFQRKNTPTSPLCVPLAY